MKIERRGKSKLENFVSQNENVEQPPVRVPCYPIPPNLARLHHPSLFVFEKKFSYFVEQHPMQREICQNKRKMVGGRLGEDTTTDKTRRE